MREKSSLTRLREGGLRKKSRNTRGLSNRHETRGFLFTPKHAFRATLFFLLQILLISGGVFGQGKPKLTTKKQELQKLRGNIELYQKKIEESTLKESVSLGSLDKLEKQNLQTRQSIKRISGQIAENSKTVEALESQIQSAGGRLSYLNGQYAHFARSFYEHGRLHDLELILTASSINEMLVRYEYLKRFSDQTKADIVSISAERDRLSGLRAQLGSELGRQQGFLAQKNLEESKLSSRI